MVIISFILLNSLLEFNPNLQTDLRISSDLLELFFMKILNMVEYQILHFDGDWVEIFEAIQNHQTWNAFRSYHLFSRPYFHGLHNFVSRDQLVISLHICKVGLTSPDREVGNSCSHSSLGNLNFSFTPKFLMLKLTNWQEIHFT